MKKQSAFSLCVASVLLLSVSVFAGDSAPDFKVTPVDLTPKVSASSPVILSWVFKYQDSVKRYNSEKMKVETQKAKSYIVFGPGDAVTTVFYGTDTNKTKWYYIDYYLPVYLTTLDVKGNVNVSVAYNAFGFGKLKMDKYGQLSSVEANGTVVDSCEEITGTFNFMYDKSTTLKAAKANITALEQVVANLVAKGYLLVE